MQDICVCLIGYGGIGFYHATVYRAMRRVRRLVVVDISEQRRQLALSDGCAAVYPSFEDALSEETLDIVDVCVPTELHYQIASQAITEGKHVIVEKPLCATMSQAIELKNAAERANLLLMCAHTERFNPAYRQAKERIPSIGRVISFSAKRFTHKPARESWRYKDANGGVVLDLMIHDIDLVQWIGNAAIERVYARGARGENKNPTHVHAVVELKTGAVGHVEAGWVLPDTYPFWIQTQMEWVGEEGIIVVSADSVGHIYCKDSADILDVCRWPNAFQQELTHFVNCASAGSIPEVPIGEVISSLQAAIGVRHALINGEPIEIAKVD